MLAICRTTAWRFSWYVLAMCTQKEPSDFCHHQAVCEPPPNILIVLEPLLVSLEEMLNSMLQLNPTYLAKEKNIEEVTCMLH